MSLLDPVVNDPLKEHRVERAPSVEVDGEEEYQVMSVEGSQIYRSQLQYLIRGLGMILLHGNLRSLWMGCK